MIVEFLFQDPQSFYVGWRLNIIIISMYLHLCYGDCSIRVYYFKPMSVYISYLQILLLSIISGSQDWQRKNLYVILRSNDNNDIKCGCSGMMQAEDGVALNKNVFHIKTTKNTPVHVVFVFFTCALDTVTFMSCEISIP